MEDYGIPFPERPPTPPRSRAGSFPEGGTDKGGDENQTGLPGITFGDTDVTCINVWYDGYSFPVHADQYQMRSDLMKAIAEGVEVVCQLPGAPECECCLILEPIRCRGIYSTLACLKHEVPPGFRLAPPTDKITPLQASQSLGANYLASAGATTYVKPEFEDELQGYDPDDDTPEFWNAVNGLRSLTPEARDESRAHRWRSSENQHD